MWLRLRNVEGEKRHLSFPPPWEFQTAISSLRDPDPFLLLGDPGLLNLPRNLLCQFSSFQLLSCVQLSATSWTAAHQASLSITNSWSLLKLLSIESVMPSNHLILCCPLLPPSIFPSIRVFSNESALPIKWPKYWSFSYRSVLPMNIQNLFPLGWTVWISLQSKGVFSNTTVQKHQLFSAQPSLWSKSKIHTWLLERIIALTI